MIFIFTILLRFFINTIYDILNDYFLTVQVTGTNRVYVNTMNINKHSVIPCYITQYPNNAPIVSLCQAIKFLTQFIISQIPLPWQYVMIFTNNINTQYVFL